MSAPNRHQNAGGPGGHRPPQGDAAKKYILVLDAGTTRVRALLFNRTFNVVSSAFAEVSTFTGASAGVIEQDGVEIFDKCLDVCRRALQEGQIDVGELDCLAITNQRATSLPWDKRTGLPLRRAINWADYRAKPIVDQLTADGWMERMSPVMMPPNYMFANLHFAWFLKNDELVRQKLAAGELCYGTLDSYLVYRLTRGKRYITSYTNVSPYSGFNLVELRWQEDFLNYLGIPPEVLPEVVDDAGDLGEVDRSFFGEALPIGALCGDQQSGMFAHGAHRKGMFKCTIGTGAFCDLCVGDTYTPAPEGLLPFVTYKVGDEIGFQIEGYVTSAGSVVRWLRDGAGLISDYSEIEPLVESVADSGGLYFVPAMAGLGAPEWEADATGLFAGLSLKIEKGHIVRAVLEGIACRIRDICDRITQTCGMDVDTVLVDGGVAKSAHLCQTIADLLKTPVERPKLTEATSLGAAELAGLYRGFWSAEEVREAGRERDHFAPQMGAKEADLFYAAWLRAKERSRRWHRPG